MNRIAKIVVACVLAGVAFSAGMAAQRDAAPAPAAPVRVVQTADEVTSFNDGYAEAMNEAEKNGPAYVHEWNTKLQAVAANK